MKIDLRYGDTIEQMKLISNKSIDFICCDLPYQKTKNIIGVENNMDYFNISLKRVEEKRKEKDFTVVTSFGECYA